ncbi:regulatory LuxR family protein [Panacagrimonas perspica]|uniref:Regulatory LuxR family protein n=1 Tax=Panacagrimonas perspica TaxID=381431 RepID=A0A4R7P4M9_9GAMM|nr:helix-turn-helix transcriptional regulator [Panacagrimonas perspica]TDU28753.1 regulatory LuxR family protein [Panacagrimonas perspica]THD02405.1 hypothetical protein B1810_15975 [Panacagrimonas perspica]
MSVRQARSRNRHVFCLAPKPPGFRAPPHASDAICGRPGTVYAEGRIDDDATNSRTLRAGAPFIQDLTERERQVLAALVQGHSNPQIAAVLFISVDCVKFHLKNIYGKLGAQRRTHAAQIAMQRGILSMR